MEVVPLKEPFVTDKVMRHGRTVDPRWRDDSAASRSPGRT